MITQLPTVVSAQLSDIIYAVQGYVSPASPGNSVQETLAQVISLAISQNIVSFAGNPNGNVAGTQFQTLCWDSTDNFLWICTTTGSTGTAVWKPIIGALTNGQLSIGSTGQAPTPNTLTAGTGISIVNAAGSITISGTAASIGWNTVTSSGSMVADNGYIVNSASPVTLTLPTTAAVGTALAVLNLNSGGWTIAQNAGQSQMIGSSTSTVGAGGSVASTAVGDAIYYVCVVANTTWMSLGAPQGNLTIV